MENKDVRQQLAGAALGQSSVKNGAVDLLFTAVYQRTTRKYGDRGIKYVPIAEIRAIPKKHESKRPAQPSWQTAPTTRA